MIRTYCARPFTNYSPSQFWKKQNHLKSQTNPEIFRLTTFYDLKMLYPDTIGITLLNKTVCRKLWKIFFQHLTLFTMPFFQSQPKILIRPLTLLHHGCLVAFSSRGNRKITFPTLVLKAQHLPMSFLSKNTEICTIRSSAARKKIILKNN